MFSTGHAKGRAARRSHVLKGHAKGPCLRTRRTTTTKRARLQIYPQVLCHSAPCGAMRLHTRLRRGLQGCRVAGLQVRTDKGHVVRGKGCLACAHQPPVQRQHWSCRLGGNLAQVRARVCVISIHKARRHSRVFSGRRHSRDVVGEGTTAQPCRSIKWARARAHSRLVQPCIK